MDDVEVISINKDSISHINSSIPSLPRGLLGLRGAQLPDGSLIINGGFMPEDAARTNDVYFQFKEGFNQWRKIGTMKKGRISHSSAWINGRLYTTGGRDLVENKVLSHLEEFSFDGDVKERTEMPRALYGHTATTFDHNKMIVIGGCSNVSKILSKLRSKKSNLDLKSIFSQNNINHLFLILEGMFSKNLHL